ncbi:MAG: hypothetical protein CM1200mP1_17090 [Candidatus Neomarinimicrobiota bacterium]|nr:MAG: hypothetical protein CM1200mP1_17090 [Candidatus Neomarinimicrobiota bacterium]
MGLALHFSILYNDWDGVIEIHSIQEGIYIVLVGTTFISSMFFFSAIPCKFQTFQRL